MISREELHKALQKVSISKTNLVDGQLLPKPEYLLGSYHQGIKIDLDENLLDDARSYLHNNPPINKNFVYYQIQDFCKINNIASQYGWYCGLPANRFLNIAALFEEMVFGFKACELDKDVSAKMSQDLDTFKLKNKKYNKDYIKIYPGDIFEYLRLLPVIKRNQISVFDFDFNGHLTKHVDDIIKYVELHGTDTCVVAAWASIGRNNMVEKKDYLPLIERLYNGWSSYKLETYLRYGYNDNHTPMRVELLMLSRIRNRKGGL